MSNVDDVLATVRRATAADGPFLAELGHVPMEGSLSLSTRRDPDFFALYAMQRGSAETFLCDDGLFAGMGSILVRDGFLDGKPQPVGYLGDLRLRGRGPTRRAFPFAYGRFFAESVARTGCTSYVTGVLASNAMAIASLTNRKKKRRAPQPFYSLLCKYEMASIQLVLPPRRRAERNACDVVTATPGDVAALASFLAADHRTRPFGYRFDDGELEHRLAHWPGFTLDDTFIARDGAGRIVGCCTAWDASPVKRYRVMRYGRDMKLVRAAVSLVSLATGCARLPAEGEDFRSLYLTNLSVLDDDPAVLHAMLRAIYAHAWRKKVHFVGVPLFERGGKPDPLAPALHGFLVQHLPFHLYGVTSSDAPRTEWPPGRPGFEIALA